MNIMTFKCKIYDDPDINNDFKFGNIRIDIDMVNSFHVGNDESYTIVYLNGFSHEIEIKENDFARLKGVDLNPKSLGKNFILIFSKN